jgi:hypothetical protein
MGLKRRLGKLEERSEAGVTEDEDLKKHRRDLELWYRTCENEQRAQQGLPPIPPSEVEEAWQRESDEEDGEELEAYFDALEAYEGQRQKNTGGGPWGS